jgi:hypothetical protein
MISKALFSLFLATTLFSNSIYNSNLLNIQAKVYPKIIISDKNLENKTQNKKITLTILYEEIDYNTALILKDKIENNYKSFKEKNLLVSLTKIDDFDKKAPLSTAYYFLLANKNKISSISHFLALNNRLTFSYDDTYLENGVIFSLKINAQIDLFLNLRNLKKSKVELENSIFNAVTIR